MLPRERAEDLTNESAATREMADNGSGHGRFNASNAKARN
jgi:hypothetical protein